MPLLAQVLRIFVGATRIFIALVSFSPRSLPIFRDGNFLEGSTTDQSKTDSFGLTCGLVVSQSDNNKFVAASSRQGALPGPDDESQALRIVGSMGTPGNFWTECEIQFDVIRLQIRLLLEATSEVLVIAFETNRNNMKSRSKSNDVLK